MLKACEIIIKFTSIVCIYRKPIATFLPGGTFFVFPFKTLSLLLAHSIARGRIQKDGGAVELLNVYILIFIHNYSENIIFFYFALLFELFIGF